MQPAKEATTSIPIVFIMHADPVGTRHVASLARPGGNITRLTVLHTALGSKILISCSLSSRRPRGSRCSGTRTLPPTPRPSRRWRSRGVHSGCSYSPSECEPRPSCSRAASATPRPRAGAGRAGARHPPFFRTERHRLGRAGLLALLAAMMYSNRDPVVAGALMSYGPNVRPASIGAPPSTWTRS